jgi:hypothetical protein
MRSNRRISVAKGLRVAVMVLAASVAVAAAASVPTGWYMAGSKPADYESGVDDVTANNGQRSAYLTAKKADADGFGTLMQNFRADQYRGKRVRLRASVKAENVQRWAGLWMRVDGAPEVAPLAFDNMEDRPIRGTTDWQHHDVVLDVPKEATGIFFGVLLTGPGEIWLSDVKFETVGLDVALTGMSQRRPIPDAPMNLDFRN